MTGRKEYDDSGGAWIRGYGTKYEDEVRKEYEFRNQCDVFETVRHYHPQWGWMGASPDGVVFGLDGTARLVEFKVPVISGIDYNNPPSRAERSVDMVSGKPTGKAGKGYYEQVQFAMEVMDIDECDFVQMLPSSHAKGFEYHQVVVKRDREWFQRVLPKLQQFYNLVLQFKLEAEPLIMARKRAAAELIYTFWKTRRVEPYGARSRLRTSARQTLDAADRQWYDFCRDQRWRLSVRAEKPKPYVPLWCRVCPARRSWKFEPGSVYRWELAGGYYPFLSTRSYNNPIAIMTEQLTKKGEKATTNIRSDIKDWSDLNLEEIKLGYTMGPYKKNGREMTITIGDPTFTDAKEGSTRVYVKNPVQFSGPVMTCMSTMFQNENGGYVVGCSRDDSIAGSVEFFDTFLPKLRQKYAELIFNNQKHLFPKQDEEYTLESILNVLKSPAKQKDADSPPTIYVKYSTDKDGKLNFGNVTHRMDGENIVLLDWKSVTQDRGLKELRKKYGFSDDSVMVCKPVLKLGRLWVKGAGNMNEIGWNADYVLMIYSVDESRTTAEVFPPKSNTAGDASQRTSDFPSNKRHKPNSMDITLAPPTLTV